MSFLKQFRIFPLSTYYLSEEAVAEEHHVFMRELHNYTILDFTKPSSQLEGGHGLGYDVAYRIKGYSAKLEEFDGRGFNLFFQYKCSKAYKKRSAKGYEIWSDEGLLPFLRFGLHYDSCQKQFRDLEVLSQNFGDYEQVFYCTNTHNDITLYLKAKKLRDRQKLFTYISVTHDICNHDYVSHHPKVNYMWFHSEPIIKGKFSFEDIRSSHMKNSPSQFKQSVKKLMISFTDIRGPRVRSEISFYDKQIDRYHKQFVEMFDDDDYSRDIITGLVYLSAIRDDLPLEWNFALS